ncbi:hypothetical protein [Paracoccus sp. SY]|uniref:hypothetical protein n=1 Tax=Paracoccus sp. SY TaxID=1330255 RepID=UPI0011AFAB5C|nr:hypothetical protein [Paracoccus sp. SY]
MSTIEGGEQMHLEMAADIRKAWAHAILQAPQLAAGKGVKIDLPEVMPHVLKPAAITWAMQRGAAIRDAAGHFSGRDYRESPCAPQPESLAVNSRCDEPEGLERTFPAP